MAIEILMQLWALRISCWIKVNFPDFFEKLKHAQAPVGLWLSFRWTICVLMSKPFQFCYSVAREELARSYRAIYIQEDLDSWLFTPFLGSWNLLIFTVKCCAKNLLFIFCYCFRGGKFKSSFSSVYNSLIKYLMNVNHSILA